MEGTVLATLEFYIAFPLIPYFLRRNSKHACVDTDTHALSKLFAEQSLLSAQLSSKPASEIAGKNMKACSFLFISLDKFITAASLYLSCLLMDNDACNTWDQELMKLVGYGTESLNELVSVLKSHCLSNLKKGRLGAIKDKYESKCFHKVSGMALMKLQPDS